MKTKFYLNLKSWLLMMLMLIGAGGNLWAEDVTVTFASNVDVGTGTSASGSNSISKDGITISCTNGGFAISGGAHYRLGASSTTTISSSVGNIKSVVITGPTGTGNYSISKFNSSTGWSISSSKGTATWNGDAVSVSIKASAQVRPTKFEVTYTPSGNAPIVDTPTFSPAEGAVAGGTEVTISCTTDGATIYYTTDGSTPSTNSYSGSSVIINESQTIKAYAVKNGYADSEIATATYTVKQTISGYAIDFENDVEYTDWIFNNIGRSTGDISAHGGSYYGSNINDAGNGVSTASLRTKEKIANPGTFTCYLSKTSTNTTSSTWYIQVSSDGTTWTDVKDQSATSMTKGDWVEFTADLSRYSDVYVRLYYNGTNAKRAVDDINLTLKNTSLQDVTLQFPETAYSATMGSPFNTLIPTAQADGVPVEGLSYTYTSSNESVATVDANTGEVTLVAAGTTVITATFAGNDEYNGASATYTLNVARDPNANDGSAEKPYTVAEARAVIDAGTGLNGVYVKGIVSGIVTEYNSQYGNISYNISADGSTEDVQLQAYRGKSYNGDNFTSQNNIEVGDLVIISGNLKKYGSTYELDANNILVSNDHKDVTFSFGDETEFEVALNKPFTAPALSKGVYDGTVTYASSDTDVATVADDGKVALVGKGTTTITASGARTTTCHTPTPASYTLTVVDAVWTVEPEASEGGTVSIDGKVITATPAEGYRFANPAYTVSSGEATVSQEGNIFTVTPASDCTVTINFEKIPEHNVVWSINGEETSTTALEDAAVEFPAAPEAIEGKTFVGWVAEAIDGETNEAPAFVTSATMGTSDLKYYAVFASQEAEASLYEKTDDLTREFTGVEEKASYAEWSGKTATSSAVYAGQSAGDKNSIQLRSNNSNSGVISTTSGGKLSKVVVVWNSETASGRTLDIYGSNTAYEAATDLYDNSKQGTKLGSIVNGTSTELTITGDYQYIGLRSNNGAMYLSKISITWEGGTPATYSGYCTTVIKPVAKIGNKGFETLQAAFNAANEGETVTLLKDYDAKDEAMAGGTRQFVINKSITFDGGGYTLTTKNRGIGIGNVNGDVTENINVTIKNVTVLNTASGARCIDTRGKIGSLTLEGVTLNTQGAHSGYTQPLTIGGNQSDVANVTITNSTIQTNDNATAYYAIITFNPVNMNVTNSTIKGWANVYAKGQDGSAGSAGSVFNFDNCTLESSNAYSNTSNAFSAFMIEDNNVTINVTNSDIVITNSGDQWQTIAGYPMNNALSGNKVTLGEGNKVKFVEPGQFAFAMNQSEGSEFTVTGGLFSTVVPDEYCAEGLTTVANTDEATKDEYPYAVGVKVELAQPIIFHDSGKYEGELTVAIAGEGVKYTLNGGAEQTYSAPFTISETTTVKAWAEKDGVKSDEVEKTFTIVAKQAGAEVADGYYNIKTNDGKFVNVAGRKTVTLVSDTEGKAGTVIRVNADAEGVKVLRSQGVDLPGYAKKAMNYVPELAKALVERLGENDVIGEDGVNLIANEFKAKFDYHLYLEKANGGYRIYGKTPSMKHVVDFYANNKEIIDSRLPKLEGFVEDILEKVAERLNHAGSAWASKFKIHDIWTSMGGAKAGLTEPIEGDEKAISKFYTEVLSSEKNVWDFAYQTAMIYWTKVEELVNEHAEQLGDYSKYLARVKNIKPDFKYYIVVDEAGTSIDFISEGNAYLDTPRTSWTLTPRTDFNVNFDVVQEHKICPVAGGGDPITYPEYYTTLYTDFAYTLPEDGSVKAYKVVHVNDTTGVAIRKEITGTIPAQTPVMLISKTEGNKTLTLSTQDGEAVTGNLLVGADALINEYKINSSTAEGILNMLKSLSESLYNDYEYLARKNSGTVNNKYFFGLTEEDLKLCSYINGNGEKDCVTRTLSNGDKKTGFYSNWEAKANQAFLVSEKFNPILLSLVGDVNRDGTITIGDVTALVNIILGKAKYPDDKDKYDFEAADVNGDSVITIGDVTKLVNIILGKE